MLALKAMQRLIAEDSFAALNKTDDFIAFAATDNGYVDYSLTMRKTIDLQLFYKVFPDIQEKDRQFEAELNQIKGLPAAAALDYWTDAVNDGYNSVTPFDCGRCEYDIFLHLQHYGNELAAECLKRLESFSYDSEFDNKEYSFIAYYLEALHFAGALTDDQKLACRKLAKRMKSQLEDEAHNLLAFAK